MLDLSGAGVLDNMATDTSGNSGIDAVAVLAAGGAAEGADGGGGMGGGDEDRLVLQYIVSKKPDWAPYDSEGPLPPTSAVAGMVDDFRMREAAAAHSI